MSGVGLDLGQVAAALAVRLKKIDGVAAAYDHVPDRLPHVPAIIVGFGPVAYTTRAGGGLTQATLDVFCVVNRHNEQTSQKILRRFLSFVPLDVDPTGGTFGGVAEAIAHDRTLDGACAACHVDPDAGAGEIEAVSFAGSDFLATSIPIRVHA